MELVTLIVSARHPDLVTLELTWASLVPGYSIPHLGLTLTRDLWSHFGPQTKLVTLVTPLGLTLTR